MQLGIHFMNFAFPTGARELATTIAETAKTADEAGATWFTFMDHYFQMEQFGGAAAPMLEGYTALGFVAGQTRNLRLGLLVTGVTYRHPGLLAKIVTTLDVLSQGRAMLGLGAAWYDREHEGLGVPFPPLGERFERLEETIQIVRQMWSDDDGPYDGAHYRLAETVNVPQPLQQPRPPILIGGTGEKKTLRLVAKYADACNIFAMGPEVVRSKLDVLARHCENEGRDYATIQKTILGGPDPLADTDAFLAEMERYAAIGIDHVQLVPSTSDPVAFAGQLGERVIPRLADITA
ncbi:LLM class F420-dependent oxidoreductase [Acrocarpospora catenulata]|uniref:LLM class F420-dependent oxidoreductase n=1 Tax=Acrocarpospora catenulata TaxID=2836182 RepID=UPI001BDB4DF8|nr:LLM class F420-dependent oxidoreductase [Acrocarpospora catenulata]